MRALLLLLLLAWPAGADEGRDSAARRHFLAGQDAYAMGRYAEALGEFTAGYALSPRPEFLYNIGLAYKNLGRTADAIDNLRRFVALAPQSSFAGSARALLLQLSPSEGQPAPSPQPKIEAPPPPPPEPRLTTPPPSLATPARPKRRAWLWATIGVTVGAVVVVAVGLGVGLAPRTTTYPSTPLPPIDFR